MLRLQQKKSKQYGSKKRKILQLYYKKNRRIMLYLPHK